MKSLLMAGAMIIATGACAFAQGGYWVVGDSVTSKCEIVTSNPVINSQVGGNIKAGGRTSVNPTNPSSSKNSYSGQISRDHGSGYGGCPGLLAGEHQRQISAANFCHVMTGCQNF